MNNVFSKKSPIINIIWIVNAVPINPVNREVQYIIEEPPRNVKLSEVLILVWTCQAVPTMCLFFSWDYLFNSWNLLNHSLNSCIRLSLALRFISLWRIWPRGSSSTSQGRGARRPVPLPTPAMKHPWRSWSASVALSSILRSWWRRWTSRFYFQQTDLQLVQSSENNVK